MGFLNGHKSLEELEMEKQQTKTEVEIAEQKALIAEAKKRYGSGGIVDKIGKFVGNTKSGMDWSALKFRLH